MTSADTQAATDPSASDTVPHRTRIKLCGLGNADDVAHAVALGADAIGLVFYPPSPRSLSIAQAVDMTREVPPFVSVVGLFVNPTADWFSEVTCNVPLSMLQFHGDETPDQCEKLAGVAGFARYSTGRFGKIGA